MKTKKSKRLLAAFLAAIMVLTTFAAMPFSSYAAEHSADELKTLLVQYETRVEGTTVYTNLVDSYEAWYSAYRTYVGVTAGLLDAEQVDTAYNTLQAEMNEMQEWTPAQATASSAADGSYSKDILVANDEMTNVLYAYGVGNNAPYGQTENLDGESFWGIASTLFIGAQYGNTVLLYDGVSTPAFPVSMFYGRPFGTSSCNARSLRPTISGFELRRNWHGYSTSEGGAYQTNYDSFVGYQDNAGPNGANNTSQYSPTRYSNTMYWNGNSSSFGSNEYSLTYNSQSWLAYTNASDSGTFNVNASIYVINYKALIDAVRNLAADVCSYSYSQVVNYFTALETAMNLDPQSYFNNSTSDLAGDVNACASAISSAVSALNNQKNNLRQTTNIQSYVDLARNYAAYTAVASGNNADGYYDANSYTVFKRGYDAATTVLNNVLGIINFTDATTTNNNLVSGYNGLRAAEKRVDDSELQACFAEYYNLVASYYVADTYDNLTTEIKDALSLYTDGDYTLGITLLDTPENQEIYNETLGKVKTAMAALRISHDASLVFSGISVSYTIAIEYVNGLDSKLYSNYDEVINAVNNAKTVMDALDQTDFTTQSEIIAQYNEVLSQLVTAIGSLQYAFTAIEDGTVVSQSIGATPGENADDVRSYLDNQIVDITYFKTEPGSQIYTTEYDLRFNNHWEYMGMKGVQLHSLGFGGYGQDTVNYDYGSMSVYWKEGGAEIAGSTGAYSSYHDLLMKTPSQAVHGSDYVNIPADTDGTLILGETRVTVNDGGIRAVSFTTPDLYEYIRVNSGVSGQESRERVNDESKQTVTVIDISDLITLVDESVALRDKLQNNVYNCYTESTWSAFTTALNAAMANMEYRSMTNDAIVADAQSRYDTLLEAKENLQINTEGTHQFVDQDDCKDATCTSDGYIHKICSLCGYDYTETVPMLNHDLQYVSNNDKRTHNIVCSRGDYEELNVACTDNGTGTCVYCGQLLYTPANWEEFNAAKAEMEALLAASADGSMKFKSSALSDADSDIAAISYYNYTETDQLTVADTEQNSVDAQTESIKAAVTALRDGIADDSVYEANQFKVSTLNADAYNVTAVQSAVQGINVETPVEVNGNVYTGYDYDNYNMALGTALTENWYEYYICVYDVDYNMYWLVNNGDGTYEYTEAYGDMPEGGFHYGDTITLTNPSSADEACRWATVAYTDNSSNYESSGTPKYQTTAESYTFNVRGNMDIYTTAAAADDETLNEIRFVLAFDGVSTGQVLDIQYARNGMVMINSLMPDIQHNIPFHSFSQYLYEDGSPVLQNNRLTVNGKMIVLVNYETLSNDSYTINLYDESNESTPIFSTYPTYNEEVTLSAPDAVAYINADNGKVLCYGSEYTFYAFQDVNVKAVTSIDEQTASVDVIKAPIVDSAGKTYIFGSFALPEGATIKSYGIVMNAGDQNDADLSLADLNKSQYIFNLSSSNYTCPDQNGNQFGISFSSSSSFPRASYVAYAIYEGADGNEYYAYSDVITQAAIY